MLDMENRLATVEAHSEMCNKLLERMDKSLEKLTDICTELGKISAVHEERIETLGELQKNTSATVAFHSKYLWMAIGIISFAVTVATILFKVF